ncbi:MAG: pseudouridine synthase family protein [Campylobacterales bacterium]
MEKAYKLLALQEGISNKKAKELIDRGVVFVARDRLKVARAELPLNTKFRVERPKDMEIILEDSNLIAVNKPISIDSKEVEVALKSKNATLIHRLDRETSGVLLLAKSDEFKEKCIKEFKKQVVYKEYIALVEGVIAEGFDIDKPIETTRGTKAISKISKNGREALTKVEPIELKDGKITKLKIIITTGATHQIRVHLKSVGYPIIGDLKYGGKDSNRLYLHSKKIELLGYSISSEEDF